MQCPEWDMHGVSSDRTHFVRDSFTEAALFSVWIWLPLVQLFTSSEEGCSGWHPRPNAYVEWRLHDMPSQWHLEDVLFWMVQHELSLQHKVITNCATGTPILHAEASFTSAERGLHQGISSWTSLKHCIHFSFILKLQVTIFTCKQLKRPAAFSAVQFGIPHTTEPLIWNGTHLSMPPLCRQMSLMIQKCPPTSANVSEMSEMSAKVRNVHFNEHPSSKGHLCEMNGPPNGWSHTGSFPIKSNFVNFAKPHTVRFGNDGLCFVSGLVTMSPKTCQHKQWMSVDILNCQWKSSNAVECR